MHMKPMVGQAATHRFHDLIKDARPSAIFKGFYDLYLEGTCVQALSIFKELAEIGHANENRLAIPHLEWAEAQTRHLIRSHTHHINIWVRDVCDKHVYDPNEDMEEQFFWRKWQAPLFLIMTPSLYTPYDAAAVWDRQDTESSSKLLQHFAEHYVLHLEVKLKKAAGAFALEFAKRPKRMELTPTEGAPTQQNLSNPGAVIRQRTDQATPQNDRYTPNNARREVRKLNTRGMHDSWQKEYRKLKKSRSGMSDVWYSQQIAKMAIARGRSAETIRKQMTK
jgi:hypothetical protein